MPSQPLEGLAPLLGARPRILLLGSMPGAESLRRQQYYAHPRNAFWPILCSWLSIDPALPYRQRCEALTEARIAVWDVLASCVREGSLDSAIDQRNAQANDFERFFRRHGSIERIGCNGRLATSLFTRHRPVARISHTPPTADADLAKTSPPHVGLPSTSPAHAAMSYERKREIWHDWLGQPQ